MRKGLLSILGIVIFGAAPLGAQTTTAPVSQPAAPMLPSAKASLAFSEASRSPSGIDSKCLSACDRPDDGLRYWARGEYLLWWVKSAPYPIPIVTTGDPATGFPLVNTAGGIGQNGTQVLLGNSSASFGAFSGGRIALGGWADDCRTIGLEASGFLLERRTNQPLEPDYTRKMIAMFETPHIPYKVIVNDAEGAVQLDDQIAALVAE